MTHEDSLRRLAAVAAASDDGQPVLAIANEEIARCIEADATWLLHHEADGMLTVLAGWSLDDDGLAVGVRVPLDAPLRDIVDGRSAGMTWPPPTGDPGPIADVLGSQRKEKD